MLADKTKIAIGELNTAQFGSFGEYIFSNYVTQILEEELVKLHRDGADFIFRGKKIDVGARRSLKKKYIPKAIRNKDASVHFCSDGCFINYPSEIKGRVSWTAVAELYEMWKKNHRLQIRTDSEISYKKEFQEIKNDITSFFFAKGFKTKIIYRTVSHKFGLKESPDNLLPKTISKNRAVVYLDFKNHIRTNENIKFIIAFPEDVSMEIPRQKKISLKAGRQNFEKVDLNGIIETNHKCYFDSIDELKQIFFLRYT